MIPDPPFQPGPLDAAAGRRPHRVELPLHVGQARERWALRLEFTAGHGPAPTWRSRSTAGTAGSSTPRYAATTAPRSTGTAPSRAR
ncbi:hypothetical protein ACFQYP_24590 [Nonomuraea antimicrobica]